MNDPNETVDLAPDAHEPGDTEVDAEVAALATNPHAEDVVPDEADKPDPA